MKYNHLAVLAMRFELEKDKHLKNEYITQLEYFFLLLKAHQHPQVTMS